MLMNPTTPEEYFDDSPLGRDICEHMRHLLADRWPDVSLRTTKSQVAFRRSRSFAFLWKPGMYLRHPAAEVVVSIALPDRLASDRFKEVVHPSEGTWMHHLELHTMEDMDQEVDAWLLAAAEAAGAAR
jgi:hypothetical protein